MDSKGSVGQIKAQGQQCNLVPDSPFHFRLLPKELRLKIYPLSNNLALTYAGGPPALLLAVAPDPVLYAEVRPIYLSQNASVSRSSQEAFKKWPMSRILALRHIRLHWEALENEWDKPFGLTGNKICLKNNLESICVVIDEEACKDDSSLGHQVYTTLEYLVVASSRSVKSIVAVIPDIGFLVRRHLELRFKAQGVLGDRLPIGQVWVWKADGEHALLKK